MRRRRTRSDGGTEATTSSRAGATTDPRTETTTDHQTETTTLDETVALVTGGAKGVGKAMATELAGRGATVVLVDSTPKEGLEAAREVARKTNNHDIDYMQADFSRPATVRRLGERFQQEYDRLDMLIHAAGLDRNESAELDRNE